MKADQFIEIFNGIAAKPGYELRAYRVWPDTVAPTFVRLHATFTAHCSNKADAPHGYPEVRTDFARIEDHDVRALADENDVYRTFLEFALRVERHEWREFLRVPSRNWMAPFHPHKQAGKDRYADTSDKSLFVVVPADMLKEAP